MGGSAHLSIPEKAEGGGAYLNIAGMPESTQASAECVPGAELIDS